MLIFFSFNYSYWNFFFQEGKHCIIVDFLFFLIIIQSLSFVFFSPIKNLNGLKIYFLFSLFFMGIAPLIHFRKEIQFWGGEKLSSLDYTHALVVVLLANFLVFFSYFISLKKNAREIYYEERVKNMFPQVRLKRILGPSFIVAIAIFSFLIVFHNFNWNAYSLFLRGGDNIGGSVHSSQIRLIIMYTIRPIPAFFLILVFLFVYKNYILKIILSSLVLLTTFPLSMPRLMVAAIYLPIIISIFPNVIKGNRLPLIISFGLLYVFPVIAVFRNWSEGQVLKYSDGLSTFTDGSFDTFQSLVRVIKYDIITYGKQLSGVILFFVPSSYWPSKPYGSGLYMSELTGLRFGNISANFFTEGYINFGLLGVFLFSIMLGVFIAFMDKKFWIIKKKSGAFYVFYFLFLGYMFFLLRGDLLSGTAFAVGLVISILLTSFLFFSFAVKRNF